MMDDLTSGYNIATNITTRYNFNQVLGFSEPEVRAMLDYYRPLSGSRVALMSSDTLLHFVIVQFRGPRLLRLDDVEKD